MLVLLLVVTTTLGLQSEAQNYQPDGQAQYYQPDGQAQYYQPPAQPAVPLSGFGFRVRRAALKNQEETKKLEEVKKRKDTDVVFRKPMNFYGGCLRTQHRAKNETCITCPEGWMFDGLLRDCKKLF